jgi:predicted anti-sigma-YlaC factor YlaD
MTFAEHPGDLLSAYLDDELSAGEMAAIDGHLVDCVACRDEMEATTWARQVLRGLRQPELPFGLVERVLARPRTGVLPMAWAAAAVAAVALGFLSLGGPQQATPPTVNRMVQAHAASTGGEPVSGLAPLAVPVSFSK